MINQLFVNWLFKKMIPCFLGVNSASTLYDIQLNFIKKISS
jgi:hypothetical protein